MPRLLIIAFGPIIRTILLISQYGSQPALADHTAHKPASLQITINNRMCIQT